MSAKRVRLLGPIGLATRSGHSFDPPPGTNLAVVNFHDVEDWPMLDQIRDYGRSLLYGRHTAKSAARRETPFDEGVLAARMGREKDDNPYPRDTNDHSDWRAGFESSDEAARACDLDWN